MSTTGNDPNRQERQYWLDDSRNVDRVVYTLYAVCVLLFAADLFYDKHPKFAFEGWFGFYAGFGFVAAFTLVLAAKLLRRVVMRDEDYYEPDDEEQVDSAR
ncbi:MAG: hypothetical protein ACOC9R_00670 [bacterium]